MSDPRLAGIEARLADVRNIVAVTGGKGGIGKTVVASLLALSFARRGTRVGLLDLDLTSPCTHLVLGYPLAFPEEPFGVTPPLHAGIACMSIALFADDTPAPLRGEDVHGALIELLAITSWGALDVLVVDMPPGLGDAHLDAARVLPQARYLAVSSDAHVVTETVRRTLRLLGRLDRPVVGLVANMSRAGTEPVIDLARESGVPFLGAVPHDLDLEATLGDPERLAATSAFRAIDEIAPRILRERP